MGLIAILFPASSSRNAPLLSLPDSTAPSVIWTRSVLLREAERMGSCLWTPQEETQPLRNRQRPKGPCGDARGDQGVDRGAALWETKRVQERRERQSRAGGAPRKPEGLPDQESEQGKWCKSILKTRPEQASVGFGD